MTTRTPTPVNGSRIHEYGPRLAVEIGPDVDPDQLRAWLATLGLDPRSVHSLTHGADHDGQPWIIATVSVYDEMGRTTGTAEQLVPYTVKPPRGVKA